MIRGTNVLVHDGMIRAVGTNLEIPASAQVINGHGKRLLPGFLGAHTHLGMYHTEQFLQDALSFGVTTELEMWGSDASLTLAPDDDAQAFVDARIAEGADFIKIIYESAFPTLTKSKLAEVVAAAHRRNKLAVVHVTKQSDARDVIAAGADGLLHIFADSAPDAGFAEFAAKQKVFIIPTLSVIEVLTGASEKPWWQDDAKLSSYITPSMRRSLDIKLPPGFGAKMKLAHAQAAVHALHRAGVSILAGTDAPSPGLAHGLSLHREMEILVNSGLSPTALASATSEAARAFGFNDRGRVAPGLRADLVLVNGDPTVDIKATRAIVSIWKVGVPYSRSLAGR